MKNRRIQEALDRELSGVRVDERLRQRIISVTEGGEHRKPVNLLKPILAFAAAFVLLVGAAVVIVGELPAGRNLPKQDTIKPLSANTVTVSPNGGVKQPVQQTLSLVWATRMGSYFHAEPDCSGMEGAGRITVDAANTWGLAPCPLCYGENAVAHAQIGSGGAVEYVVSYPAYATPEPVRVEESTPRATVEPIAITESVLTTEPMPTTEPVPIMESALTDAMPYPEAIPTPEPEYKEPVPTVETETLPAQNDHETSPEVLPVSGDMKTSVAPIGEEAEGESLYAVATPEPTPPLFVSDKDGVCFWMTDKGTYYHTARNCSGMEGAYSISADEVNASGRQPCPLCAAEHTEEQMTVWTTKGGTYYHAEEHCSGMEGAYATTIDLAVLNGNEACPACNPPEYAPEMYDGERIVWSTQNGTFYHVDRHCSGMRNAIGLPLQSIGGFYEKQPCPVCGAPEYVEEVPKQEEVTLNTLVWGTPHGLYYHTLKNCSGMTNAGRMPLRTALLWGKGACPACDAPHVPEGTFDPNSPAALEQAQYDQPWVWTTQSEEFYHLDSDCAGEPMGAEKPTVGQVPLSTAQGIWNREPCIWCDPPVMEGTAGERPASEAPISEAPVSETYAGGTIVRETPVRETANE